MTPTTPAALKAEQERVLKLYKAAEHPHLEADCDPSDLGSYFISAMQSATNFTVLDAPNHDKVLGCGLWEGDAQLWAAAPTLARAYADLLAAHAEALARERWIPVGERLPEEGVAVQVYVTELGDLGQFKYQQVSSLCNGRWQWLEGGARPTHWQPLPAPPHKVPQAEE